MPHSSGTENTVTLNLPPLQCHHRSSSPLPPSPLSPLRHDEQPFPVTIERSLFGAPLLTSPKGSGSARSLRARSVQVVDHAAVEWNITSSAVGKHTDGQENDLSHLHPSHVLDSTASSTSSSGRGTTPTPKGPYKVSVHSSTRRWPTSPRHSSGSSRFRSASFSQLSFAAGDAFGAPPSEQRCKDGRGAWANDSVDMSMSPRDGVRRTASDSPSTQTIVVLSPSSLPLSLPTAANLVHTLDLHERVELMSWDPSSDASRQQHLLSPTGLAIRKPEASPLPTNSTSHVAVSSMSRSQDVIEACGGKEEFIKKVQSLYNPTQKQRPREDEAS